MSQKSLVPIVLPADPTAALEAATKQYVDGKAGAGPNFTTDISVNKGSNTGNALIGRLWLGEDDATYSGPLTPGAGITTFSDASFRVWAVTAAVATLVMSGTATNLTAWAPLQTLTGWDNFNGFGGAVTARVFQDGRVSLQPATDVSPLTIIRGTDTSPAADLLAVKNHAGVLIAGFCEDGSVSSQNMPGVNFLDNGNLQIWQRGTSITPGAAGTAVMTADRWQVVSAGAALTSIAQSLLTSIKPFTSGSQFGLALTGATSVTTCNIGQRIESEAVARLSTGVPGLVDPYVTFTFVVRNATGAAFTPTILIGTPAAQDVFTTVTNIVTQALQSCISGATTVVTYTALQSSVAGWSNSANGLQVELQIPSGSLNANTKTVTLIAAKVEVGPGPTPIIAQPYQQELHRCQRHYYRLTAAAANDRIGAGVYNATTSALCFLQFPVTMRRAPISVTFGAQTILSMLGAVSVAGTAIALGAGANPSGCQLTVTCAAATAGQGCLFYFNTATNAWIAVSCEL